MMAKTVWVSSTILSGQKKNVKVHCELNPNLYLYWKEKERKNIKESLRLWYNHTAGVGEADT